MKKRFPILIAIAILVIAAIAVLYFALSKRTVYEVRSIPVIQGETKLGNMDLRFYKDYPHVACYGMKAYLDFLRQEELTVTRRKDGCLEFTAPTGASVLVDPAADTITADDWALFQNSPVPYTSMTGMKDDTCGFSYITDISFDDPPTPVVFDFAKYGIPIYSDAEDVYMPIGMLSTMFVDIAMNYTIYNGETVYRSYGEPQTIAILPDKYYESDKMRGLLTGQVKRTEDEILENYGELCFIIDHFYGYPGNAVLEDSIREVGLDEALKAKDARTRDALLSADMAEYLSGMSKLINEYMDDGGHTRFIGTDPLYNKASPYYEDRKKFNSMRDPGYTLQVYNIYDFYTSLDKLRKDIWGDDAYRECGSTAIIRLNDFLPDGAGWEAYYSGTGEIPSDELGNIVTGLKKASENPAIKNILLDNSTNTGGCSDYLSAIVDYLTGKSTFPGYNTLTGQNEHLTFHTDKNLDGVFNADDDEVKYDFNYAVLITGASYSCGNFFPFMMREEGALILGETSGGGSCSIQPAMLSNGLMFIMSSYLWVLVDEDGGLVEDGCTPDIIIEKDEQAAADPKNPGPGYTKFYDDVMLDQMISEWFAKKDR